MTRSSGGCIDVVWGDPELPFQVADGRSLLRGAECRRDVLVRESKLERRSAAAGADAG